MTELESLGFYNTPLTDEGLKYLAGLKRLRILGLGVTKITPQGLRQLKDLPIERLNIIACHPVASELKVLKEFPRLSHLEASGLKLIDRDADLLAELQTLETLALNRNRLTDQGLQKLAALKNLKELAITDNPVTAEGVAKFQKALPKCVVHWDKK
jgi:Leucine-rich repeat (LRR) protein